MGDGGAAATGASSGRRDSATAVMLVVVVGLLMQAGSAVAVLVIESVGVVEALWLRTALAALMLAAVRPRLAAAAGQKGDRLPLLALTVSLLAMNFSFYEAISRAPVGIVVAVEFLGPLGVAVAGSRRLLDGLWVVLAAVGIGCWPTERLGRPGRAPVRACAAGCWAAFILLGQAAQSRERRLAAGDHAMLVGRGVVADSRLPWRRGSSSRATAGRCCSGLAVAVLSSALPYSLELAAIKRVRASTYGVLLSIEPAIAALWGLSSCRSGSAMRESSASWPSCSRRRGRRGPARPSVPAAVAAQLATGRPRS